MKPIEKMTYTELLEAQERHKKMVGNSKVLQKLPDKGKKFLETQKKIEERLQKCQQEPTELVDLFSGLKIAPQKIDVHQMEWTGRVPEARSISPTSSKDSHKTEEDERDIVNILLSTNLNSKIIIDERKDAALANTSSSAPKQEQFYQHLVEKVERLHPTDNKFKPYSTLKHENPLQSNLHPKWWENTAATPPVFKYSTGVKPINIEESLELQVETEERLKQLELQRSRAKFILAPSRFVPETPNPVEHVEVFDEDAEDSGGGVVCIAEDDDVE